MRCVETPEANIENAIDKISKARKKGAQIVCLPELFTTLYFPQKWSKAYFAYAETIPGRQVTHRQVFSEHQAVGDLLNALPADIVIERFPRHCFEYPVHV